MERPSYLDHNATTPVRPAVAEAVGEALARLGNASSVHGFGRLVRKAVEEAREEIAALVGAGPGDVVFTSGGTEANNLALRGAGCARVLVSAVEHVSVLKARSDVGQIPVDGDGVVDLEALDRLLAADGGPTLVSVMLANNETGVVQPVRDVVERARRHGARVHCDAVQAAGKIPVSMDALGVDMLSLSAHKMGGPQGVGALVVGDGVPIAALNRGGGQERGRRAGTENAPGIVGFGTAAALARESLGPAVGLGRLRDRLEARLRALAPGVRIFAAGAERLPNTSCFALPGIDSATQVMALDLAGVAVSSGSACSSGRVAESHVLKAMGAAPDEVGSAIRVSLGWTSEAADIDRFIAAWSDLCIRKGALPAVPAA